MKTVLSLVLLFSFVCVANAQPPWAGQGKFGIGPGQFGNWQELQRNRNPIHDSLGLPGIRNWGGQPFPPFSSHHPWGRMNDGQVGPSPPFRGPLPYRGHGYQRGKNEWSPGYKHRGQKSFERFKSKGNNSNNKVKVCPFCGVKLG
jgi:hypothetical protein